MSLEDHHAQQRERELRERAIAAEQALARVTAERDELRRTRPDRGGDIVQLFAVLGQRRASRARDAGELIASGELTEADVRLSLRLVVEEFFELLAAAFTQADSATMGLLSIAASNVHHVLAAAPLRVDLPALVDATVDIDVVVEGLRVRLGVDGRPVWAAVHAANMTKASGPVRADGKRLKPEGFRPPDVAGLLREQGWPGAPSEGA